MLKNIVLKGNILLKSGLHIGGSEQGIQIGGLDNAVIRNPITEEPYIPGSSLKGKMRFLLEHYFGLVKNSDIPGIKDKISKEAEYEFEIDNSSQNPIAVLFGHLDHNEHETYPTRVVFRDAQVVGAMLNFQSENPEEEEIIPKEEAKKRMRSNFSETKTEVSIDRLSGTVNKRGGLRTVERVPAGTVFEFEITIREFKNEDSKYKDIIKKGLDLIEKDALGGYGSRGSGRVKFFNVKEITDNSN